MMKFRHKFMGMALTGALLFCSGQASAQVEPYYFAPRLMYSHTTADNFETSGWVNGFNKSTGTYPGGKDKSDNAFGGGIAAGYDFGAYGGLPIRLELEYLYRGNVQNSYKPARTSSVGLTTNWLGQTDYVNAPSTNVTTLSAWSESKVQTLMANIYLDFPNETAVTPFIGAGLGGAYVNSKYRSYVDSILGHDNGYWTPDQLAAIAAGTLDPANSAPGGHLYAFSGGKLTGEQNDWNLAWQLSAGLSFAIRDNIMFDVSYRYSDFGKADFGTHGYQLTGVAGAADGTNEQDVLLGTMSQKASYDLKAHEVLVGLRIYAF